MAIYATPELTPAQARAAACGVDIQVLAGPPRDVDPGDVGFIFWAMQVSFVDTGGTIVGGGHFGLQWFAAARRTRFGVINWGVYDDTIGNYATFRGSVPVDPRFVDIGIGPSWGMDFEYGDWCRFRCDRSPRQDWTARELDTGDKQPRAYRGDQRADEVAYRLTVENVTARASRAWFRDVLIKRCDPDRPLAHPVLWTETSNEVLAQGPVARFANLWWDTPGSVSAFRVSYAPGTTATNCFVDDDGAIRQEGGCRRTIPADKRLTLPS